MILYNVTVKVNHESAAEWLRWMREEHIPDLMETGLFIEAKVFRLLETDESDGLTYAAQYFCNSMEDYQVYIERHAAAMRAKGLEKFGDKFIAFRTVMEQL